MFFKLYGQYYMTKLYVVLNNTALRFYWHKYHCNAFSNIETGKNATEHHGTDDNAIRNPVVAHIQGDVVKSGLNIYVKDKFYFCSALN